MVGNGAATVGSVPVTVEVQFHIDRTFEWWAQAACSELCARTTQKSAHVWTPTNVNNTPDLPPARETTTDWHLTALLRRLGEYLIEVAKRPRTQDQRKGYVKLLRRANAGLHGNTFSGCDDMLHALLKEHFGGLRA
jgi:hypothetical protein